MLADVTMSSLARFSCLDRQQRSFAAKQIFCLPGQRLKKTQNQKPKTKNQTIHNTKFHFHNSLRFWNLPKDLCILPCSKHCVHAQSDPGRSCRSFLNRTCSRVSYELRLNSVLSWNANYITKIFQLDFKECMRYTNILEGWFSPWGKVKWEGSFFETI